VARGQDRRGGAELGEREGEDEPPGRRLDGERDTVARTDAVGDGEALGEGAGLLVETLAGQDRGAVDDGGVGRPAVGQPLQGPGRGKRARRGRQRLGGSPAGLPVPAGFWTGVTFGYWNSCRDIFMRDTIGSSTLRPQAL
jgi:hypothetical protein